MSDILDEFKGVNGQIDLYQDKIIIKRKGALAKMSQGFFKGEKTIYIKQITGIQLKLGGALTNGYFQFTVPGGIESKTGIFDATKDENSVMFTFKQNSAAKALKEKIERFMAAVSEGASASFSTADEISKYNELLRNGVITQDEFDAKKKQLLRI